MVQMDRSAKNTVQNQSERIGDANNRGIVVQMRKKQKNGDHPGCDCRTPFEHAQIVGGNVLPSILKKSESLFDVTAPGTLKVHWHVNNSSISPRWETMLRVTLMMRPLYDVFQCNAIFREGEIA
ncbi:MAG TPA: hypothetical protein PKJ47_12995 [Candidatus Limiplasma sp.]|nr:hypothetical protein [Candidatus Limiplasma sp.]